jgi:hypothetical protein
MESLPHELITSIIGFVRESSNLKILRLVNKTFYACMHYKVIKIYPVDNYNLELKVKDGSIVIDYKQQHEQVSDHTSFTYKFFNMLETMNSVIQYEDNFEHKRMNIEMTRHNKDKHFVLQDKQYDMIVYSNYNNQNKHQFKFKVPVNGGVYDFKYFLLELRDMLPRENKDISLQSISKFDSNFKKEYTYEIYYYKISRDLPDSVFEKIMFNKMFNMEKSRYETFYKEIEDKVAKYKILKEKEAKARRCVHICPCCMKVS